MPAIDLYINETTLLRRSHPAIPYAGRPLHFTLTSSPLRNVTRYEAVLLIPRVTLHIQEDL